MSCLPDNEHLTVQECLLQLHVKHKCGSSHVYLIRSLVADESKLADQLNEDLAQLVRMMQERAHFGVLEINGRKYHATEAALEDHSALRTLVKDMPALVLRPRLQSTPVSELVATSPEYQAEAQEQAKVEPEQPVPDFLNLLPPGEEIVPVPAEEEQKPSVDHKRRNKR